MKTLYLLAAIYTGCTLAGCAEINTTHTTHTKIHSPHKVTSKATPPNAQYFPKNPMTVSFYPTGKDPKHPYVVLGKETISKYNVVGIKRQEASIHDAMRNLAAAMGGDAVINIQLDGKTVTGTVIAYEKTAPTTASNA